jgi:hypothetical protein
VYAAKQICFNAGKDGAVILEHVCALSSLCLGRTQSRSTGRPALGRIASSHLTVERQLIPPQ